MVIQKTYMNENISFLRIRPCDNNNEIYLNSRRKEGTSAFLIKSELDLDISEIHKKDFQTLSKDVSVDSCKGIHLFDKEDYDKEFDDERRMQMIADTVKYIYNNPIDWVRAYTISKHNYSRLQRRYDEAVGRLSQTL